MYTVTATDINGKISEMKLYVRPDFDFYLNQARTEALRIRPTSTHHAECFYPLYTYFLARRYQPNAQTDSIAEKYTTKFFLIYLIPNHLKCVMENFVYKMQQQW